ncbi:hypothetical protein [Patulibacter americanus]|uniref:hypothetical protein n=1 Tax=Patulibacter americanus TaxID=588672 RepID=UPI0003B65A05|nr:hypothetical protein [Patulibacter americanus]
MMHPEAPTRLDRTVLAFASGPVGHLLGTLLELATIAGGALRQRAAAAVARRRSH